MTTFISAKPQYSYSPGTIYGLNIRLTSPGSKLLTVSPGYCVDSTNTFNMVVPDSINIDGATVGLNGLDTGTLAVRTVYYVYIVVDETGFNAPAAVLSLSPTAPQMPRGKDGTNYSTYRRIGFQVTDSSANFLNLRQSGSGSTRTYYYDSIIEVLLSGASTSYTLVNLTPAVPTGAVRIELLAHFNPGSTVAATYSLRPYGSASTANVTLTGPVASQVDSNVVPVTTGTISGTSGIEYINSTSGCSLTLYLTSVTENL